jgi:hypothetical protein
MTLRHRFTSSSPIVAIFAAAALSGCVLDMSTKDSCERDEDCLNGYSCTRANVCEANINLGPDATSLVDASPFYPDAEVEDGGSAVPDAAVYDGGTFYPDAAVEDGGAFYPDASVEDGGAFYPDAAVEPDASPE